MSKKELPAVKCINGLIVISKISSIKTSQQFLQPEGPFVSQQHLRAESHNLYVESQVVAEFPAKFQHSNALPNEHLTPSSIPQLQQQFRRPPIIVPNTIV